jgi:hypothetical protein
MYKIVHALPILCNKTASSIIIGNKVSYQLKFVDVTSKGSKYKEKKRVTEQKRNRTYQNMVRLA